MLEGKTVFVSGGTGYLGRGIVKKCAEYGADVIFSYNRNESQAKVLEADIPSASSVAINLRDVADITKKIETLYEKTDRIDVLVNNAAVSQILPLSLLDEEDVDLVLDVNMKGLIFLTKAVVRGMIRNKRGVIINMGSVAGQRILDVPLTYAMTKAAVSGMTYSLAAELKKFNIRVNSIVPGMMDGGVAKGVPDDLKADFIKHCASGRVGSDQDVAELTAFLASERSNYINGQNITIDGGIY